MRYPQFNTGELIGIKEPILLNKELSKIHDSVCVLEVCGNAVLVERERLWHCWRLAKVQRIDSLLIRSKQFIHCPGVGVVSLFIVHIGIHETPQRHWVNVFPHLVVCNDLLETPEDHYILCFIFHLDDSDNR